MPLRTAFHAKDACLTTCRPIASAGSRASSFGLRGLTWRSFTQRRPSQQLAAPPAMHPGQTQQPPASAQITPRVQPSQLPTPRLLADAEPSLLPPMANGRSQQLPPVQGLPGKTIIVSALEAAAAAEMATAEAGDDAQHSAQQQQHGATQQPGAEAEGGTEQQQQEQQQQQELSLTSWRSDAVQLPEQLLLPDGLPASPTSSTDTTGATAIAQPMRTRGRQAYAAGRVDGLVELSRCCCSLDQLLCHTASDHVCSAAAQAVVSLPFTRRLPYCHLAAVPCLP